MAKRKTTKKVGGKGKETYGPVASPSKRGKKETTSGVPDLSVLNAWHQFTVDTWRTKRWDFFVIDQFVRGNHNITGDPVNNTLYVENSDDYIAYPINKIFANFRAIRGFVTRHKPKVEVLPSGFSDASKQYSRRSNAILNRDNRLNNVHKINKEWAYYGIKYGVGYRQVGYDKNKHVSIRWSIDPFDLGVGSQNGKMEDAPFLIKSIVRTVGYWKNKFPKANVVPDNKVADDEYKQLSMQIENPMAGQIPIRDDEQTAIGYEAWYRVYKPNKMGGLINKCLFTKSEVLDFSETPYKEFPFIAYEADIIPNEQYPEGHLKHQIAPQRLYNLLNNQMLEYNYLVNKGRFQFAKGSGFEVIKAKEGQIIRYNPGKPVQAVPPPPINPSLQWQIQKVDEDHQLIGAYNDASFGRLPTSNASGDLVEALQLGDTNNISELRENFEDALSLEASMILNMYSLFEDKGFDMEDKYTEKGEEKTDQFRVIGQQATTGKSLGNRYYSDDNGSYLDYLSVSEDNQVKVTVTSELGETRNARMNLLIKLVELGLPLKFLFEQIEFPNTDDVMQRIAEEAVGSMAMDRLRQGPPQGQGQPANMPQPGGSSMQ